MDNLLLLRDWLQGVESDQATFEQQPYYRRFQLALGNLRQTGNRDIAVLIRSILRYEQERQTEGDPPFLAVPFTATWPNESMWRECGMEVIERQDSYLLVRPCIWMPGWLPQSSDYPPEQPLFQEVDRKQDQEVFGDPFLSTMHKNAYRNEGQKNAIRTILTAPKSATIAVNLPTGSGKSLCVQLPAMLGANPLGVTVVIVPTVALAIDQERAMAEFIDHPTAYYAAPGRKAANDQIYRRIMDGTQTIVFTSPESVLQSLDKPLQKAAERGYFRMLVIDEAHIVEAWGLDFRTSFQELAGWRNRMLRLAEFQTILLSATMTRACLDSLEQLFGEPGPFRVFSAVHLRPEPSYWFSKCESEVEKQERIIEAVHHLPRPLILYTSTVNDAVQWHRRLNELGYRRCGLMTGDTDPDRREVVMQQWREQQFDIMVATSAFGLGVDQADVHAVVHACVTETLDRFYQEVGRGGRDGKASLSLVVYTSRDIRTAEKMNRTLLIRMGRCKQRWEEMFRRKVSVEGEVGSFRVPIDVPPGTYGRDLDMRNDYNELWHVRTLTLLNQVGVIRLDWPDSDEPLELKNQWRWIYVPNDDPEYGTKIDTFRRRHLANLQFQLKQMKDILQGTTCTAIPLTDLYSITNGKPWQVRVAGSCGGCPVCRMKRQEAYAGNHLSRPIIWDPIQSPTEYIRTRYLQPRGQMVVFYPPSFTRSISTWNVRDKDGWMRVIRWFVDQGMLQIVATRNWLEALEEETFLHNRVVFFTEIEHYPKPRMWLNVPTLVIGDERHAKALIQHPLEMPAVYVLPDTVEHPTLTGRKLRDVVRCRRYGWEEFRREVGL